jgi:hypothetical protein
VVLKELCLAKTFYCLESTYTLSGTWAQFRASSVVGIVVSSALCWGRVDMAWPLFRSGECHLL